jgi:AraC-like DNA-binding protein
VFFSSPQRSIALRWQEGCEQVLIRIPHAMLAPEGRFQVAQSGVALPAALTTPFVHQVSAVLAMARQPAEQQGLADWQGALQDWLAQIVALSLGLPQPQKAGAMGEPDRSRNRRERLEGFIAAHLDRPIQLADLGRTVGLAHSQLCALTQKAFGCAPMALVRRMRLLAVRQSLEADPGQDLTQLSLRYGFDHQGRFSQYYRQEFGEVPSATRRRLRGLGPTGRNG